MKISRHFIFTFPKRKVNKMYGGEDYTINVYENKGRGKLIFVGDTHQTTRSHCGFETEAFHVILRANKRLKNKLKKVDKGFNGYWQWQYANDYGIRIEQIA